MIPTILDVIELGLTLAQAVGVWLLVERFVVHYRAQGVPVQPWYPREGTRGNMAVAMALLLACFLAVTITLRLRGVPFGTRTAVTSVTALLAVVAAVDLAVHRIPNRLILAVGVFGGLTAVAVFGVTLSQVLLGALVGGTVLLAIALLGRGAMGMGDVKLAAALGALVGYPHVLPALAIGMVAGGIAALVLLVAGKVGRKDYIAYGPYLALGAWFVLLARVW